jgi:SAM-dependent methyltransferase
MDHGLMDHGLSVSPWVARFVPLIPAAGTVLDLACGRGRHTRLLLHHGFAVVAVDRDLSRLEGLRAPRLETLELDLEGTGSFPLADRCFDGIVVTNYLHRPMLGDLIDTLVNGGMLIYETFAEGNERFGRPSNPDYLLRHGELLDLVREGFRVVAYEDLDVVDPRPASVQRIAALRHGNTRPM